MCCADPQGPQAIDFVEHVTVGDFQGLQNGTGTLSLITNDKGGIVDDTVTTRVSFLRFKS